MPEWSRALESLSFTRVRLGASHRLVCVYTGAGAGQGPTASGAVELKTSSSALFPMKPGNFRFSCLLGRQERQEFQNFIPSIRPSLKNAALPSISSLVSSLSQVFITHFSPPSTLWFELLQCLSVLADVVNKLS